MPETLNGNRLLEALAAWKNPSTGEVVGMSMQGLGCALCIAGWTKQATPPYIIKAWVDSGPDGIKPRKTTLAGIAAVLDVTVDWLCEEGDDDGTATPHNR